MFERAKFGAGIMADETPGSTAAANAAHEGARAAGGCDPMALLRATAQQAVKDLADGVVIAALVEGEHPGVSPFIVEHRTPEGTAHAREFVAADNSQSPLLRRVIESGETCIVNHMSAARAAETVTPESRGFFTKVPVASLMIAPVFEKGAMIGTFGCWREGPARPFESRDQRAVERLARSVAPALFRSRPTRHPYAGPGPVLEGWLELTHELLATSNPEGFLSDLNPAWERTLGWPREVLRSRPLIAFVHPADVEKTLAALPQTSTRDAGAVAFENRLRCQDGAYRCLEWTCTVDGSTWHFVGRDVSDQKAAEGALERGERELRTTQRVALIGSWDWDLKTNDLHWSDQLYDLLGLDRGTAASWEAYLELVNPEDLEAMTKIRDALARHDAFRHEVRMRRPDGEIVVESRGRVLHDTDGRPIVMRGTAQDMAEVRRHERAHAAVIESALDCIVTMDHTGRVMEFNPAAERAFGYTREEARGQEVAELLIPARLKAAYHHAFAKELEGGESEVTGRRIEISMSRCDGSELPVELTVARTDDTPPTLIGFIRDLTQQHEVVCAARLSQERYRQIVETSTEGIWTVDLAGNTTLVNPAMASMLGYEPDAMLGRALFEFMDEQEASRVREEMASYGESPPAELEGRFKHRDGSDVWVSKRLTVLRDGRGERIGRLGMITDITERRVALQRQQMLNAIVEASDDAILGCDREGVITAWNRGAEKLYGYSADEAIGANLAELMLIPPARTGEHQDIFDRVAASGPVDHRETEWQRKDGHRVQVSITSYPTRDADGNVTGMGVVARDITERKAHEEHLQRELEGVVWVGPIREALEEDRFVLWGQPIIDLQTGETVQEELLIRMVDNEGQIVAPGHFLPAAEKYGLIGEIDRWVVGEAFALAADGRNVEVNLSADSVGRPEVLAVVEHELEASGADPANIIFEITETALMQNLEAGTEFARRLSELGCQFALDDFGTGFGSFTYLKRLPVDFLKIDVDFVRELTKNPADQHVVRAVVNLASGFGMKTVAEGVEDEATIELLRDFGVDYAQGYHIGRPGPLQGTATTPTAEEARAIR